MENTNGESTYSVRDVEQFLNNIKQNYDSRIKISEDMIQNLKMQNQELQNILKKHIENEEQLSMALRNAEKKSHNIENSLRNVYDLKTKQMALLYKKLEKNLNALQQRYQAYISMEEINNLTAEFHMALSLSLDTKQTYNNYVESTQQSSLPDDDFDFKDVGYRAQQNHKSVISKSFENRLFENFAAENMTSAESTADQFLNREVDQNTRLKSLGKNRMNNIIPRNINVTPKQSNGFSLEEALVPNQSLEEIMMAFDIEIEDKN